MDKLLKPKLSSRKASLDLGSSKKTSILGTKKKPHAVKLLKPTVEAIATKSKSPRSYSAPNVPSQKPLLPPKPAGGPKPTPISSASSGRSRPSVAKKPVMLQSKEAFVDMKADDILTYIKENTVEEDAAEPELFS